MNNEHYLIFDMGNMLYRTYFAYKNEDIDDRIGIAHHMALMTLNKYYKQFNPTKVVMAFDRSSWRKQYTSSEKCVSKKLYKGDRRKKMTPSEKEKFERFLEHAKEFEEIMKKHTSVICVSEDELEADDFIGLYTQIKHEDKITIVSNDTDFMQLIEHDRVSVFDPSTGKPKSLKEWNNDPNFYLFVKCFRGDKTDNIQSAYPRVHKSTLLKAYNDDYELNKLLQKTWTDDKDNEFLVKDLYHENRFLIDLTQQPKNIQKKGITKILENENNPGEFSFFYFMKFLGANNLKKISENVDNFVGLLS